MHARLAVVLLALALPLTACSDDAEPTALAPTTSAPTPPAPTPSAPATAPKTPAAPTPSTPAPDAGSTDEGVVYGKITSATADGFTYDKVTYDEAGCNAVEGDDNLRYDVKTASCFVNDNPRLRTVRFAATARVEVTNEGNRPVTYRSAELVDLLGDQANVDTPAQYRVWEITVRSGRATRVATFQVVGA